MNECLFSTSHGRKRSKVTQLCSECFRQGLLQLSVLEGVEFQTVWAARLLLCPQGYQATTPVLFKAEVKSQPNLK